MSKIAGPLHSDGVSGITGDVVYAQWKGMPYSRIEPLERRNPKTPSQQVNRGYFKEAVKAWQGESSTVRTGWTNYANTHAIRMLGYNLYVGAYVRFMMDHTGTPPTVTNTPPTMS